MNTSPIARRSRQERLAALSAMSLLMLAGVAACGGGEDTPPAAAASAPTPTAAPAAGPTPAPSPSPAPAAALTSPTQVTTVASGLDHPWGLAFLPDGRYVVTQRAGTMLLIGTSGSKTTITGVPQVEAVGQGGLLDVALDPAFASNRLVYWSYTEAAGGSNGLAVARGELDLTTASLGNVQVIHRQTPKVSGSTGHYGGRIVFANDGKLFVMMGDRQIGSERGYAQDITRNHGKVARINTDGSIPTDNPFFTTPNAKQSTWSLGHRNPQGAAINPATGDLWVIEHGPQGGDELNVVRSGLNYGWPLVSYGCEYGTTVGNCTPVGGATSRSGFEPPVAYWVPTSTAPSGLMFYTGTRFTAWTGKAFAGALSGKTLWQFDIDQSGAIVCTPTGGQTRTHCGEVTLVKNQNARIRDVRQGPNGYVFLLTDDGNNGDKLLRLQ